MTGWWEVQPGPLASTRSNSEEPSCQERSWAGESPASATTYLVVIINTHYSYVDYMGNGLMPTDFDT